MRNRMTALGLAASVATFALAQPAIAQTPDQVEDRQDAREDRRDQNEDARDRQENRQDRAEDRQDRREDIRDAREDRRDARTDGGYWDRREDRQDRREDIRDAREDRQDQREDVRDRRENRVDQREDRRDAREDWRDSSGRWQNVWRRDTRYNWRDWRTRNRALYSWRYTAPRGYNYRRFGVGARIAAAFLGSSYWLNDPTRYRLPRAYGNHRWIRYYNDAVLVDGRTGMIIDVEHDFFY